MIIKVFEKVIPTHNTSQLIFVIDKEIDISKCFLGLGSLVICNNVYKIMFKDIKFYSYLSITCRVKSDKFSEISDQTQIRNYFAELCRDRILDIDVITRTENEDFCYSSFFYISENQLYNLLYDNMCRTFVSSRILVNSLVTCYMSLNLSNKSYPSKKSIFELYNDLYKWFLDKRSNQIGLLNGSFKCK